MPADDPAVTTESALAERVCGRCRKQFPADPSLHPTAMPEWWACEPCHLALHG